MISLYSIKDMKSDFGNAILSFPNDESAKRAVMFVREQNELYKRCPSDFVLYRVGDFDFESGNIVPCNSPVYVCDMTFGGNDEDMA